MAQDLHLWLRLARCSDLFVPESVALVREHAASQTRQARVPGAWDIAMYSLLWRDESFRPHRADLAQRLAATYQRVAYYHRLRGERRKVARAAAGALRSAPRAVGAGKNMAAALLRRRCTIIGIALR